MLNVIVSLASDAAEDWRVIISISCEMTIDMRYEG
jgi:hypothetical protein